LEAFREALLALFDPLFHLPWTLRLASFILESFFALVILVLADYGIEFGCQLILRLDRLQGLDPGLGLFVVMLFMVTIRDYVEVSRLHSIIS
jgi:hypothetical protein